MYCDCSLYYNDQSCYDDDLKTFAYKNLLDYNNYCTDNKRNPTKIYFYGDKNTLKSGDLLVLVYVKLTLCLKLSTDKNASQFKIY